MIRRFQPVEAGFRWEGVAVQEYKPVGEVFQAITRQRLFGAEEGLPGELRYFELAPGGWSSLEQHRHVHAVLVLQGHGRVLIGTQVFPVSAFDLVYVPPDTWHQFRADAEAVFGFLCLVDCQRDRPVRPTEAELARLRVVPEVADFIRA